MTNEECRAIIQQIVLTGAAAEIDTIDDSMDLAIFRAGMEAAAKICESLSGCGDRGQYCAQEIREAARE